jgi:IS30 family transposase
MTDKATQHTSLQKLENGQSNEVSKATIKKLIKVNYPMHTISSDNDIGFADHYKVADALNVTTYFPLP